MRDRWNDRAGQNLARKLKAQWEEVKAPCWLCHQPIDYSAPPQTMNACEPDHVLPRDTYPELALEEDNIRPAHSACNRSRGNRPPPPNVGRLSRDWFS